MKKILIIVLVVLFFTTDKSFAGDCDTTISSATTNQLECADDDILNVTSAGSITYNNHKAVDLEDESGVQITNDGTIETEDGTNKQKAIHAESSLNTTITNNGTINSDNNEGIYLDYAENVTITNNTGATISAEGSNAIEGRKIRLAVRVKKVKSEIRKEKRKILSITLLADQSAPIKCEKYSTCPDVVLVLNSRI